MNLTIYIDVLFLLNFIVNYIILVSTALVNGAEIITKRKLIASAAGALYNVLIFFPNLRILNIILLRLGVSALLVLIAFKYINLMNYAKSLLTYYAVNIVYGGGIYFFYNFTVLGSKMNYSNGIYYINLPFPVILVLCFVFYFLIKVFTKISDGRITQKSIKKTEIYFRNTKITVSALIDTGNSLYDPISLLPVMIIEKNSLHKKIPESLLGEIAKADSSSLLVVHNALPELRFRLIPFKDITGNKSNIFAFKPQSIKDCESNKTYNNMLVGIVDSRLTEDGSYNALLHLNK